MTDSKTTVTEDTTKTTNNNKTTLPYSYFEMHQSSLFTVIAASLALSISLSAAISGLPSNRGKVGASDQFCYKYSSSRIQGLARGRMSSTRDEVTDTKIASSESEATITWETEVAQTIAMKLKLNDEELESSRNTKEPFLVAVVGIPGSGKTTSSKVLSDTLTLQGITNMVMPMDGYHLPLATLEEMDNVIPGDSNYVYRRGAPDTFDSSKLKNDLERIKASEEIISIPGFDHAKGDPEPGVYTYEPHLHKVVICEGLYLLHANDGWEDIGDLFHLSVFIRADVDVCVERLKVRNLCIPGYSKEEIEVRCDVVDRKNAMTVLGSSGRADLIMNSVAF